MSDDALRELAEVITLKQGDAVVGTDITHGELTVEITLAAIPAFMDFLKTDMACRFSTLVDITAVDYPSREKRFEMVWHFLSMYQNHRIRVKCPVREDDVVPSITGVHPRPTGSSGRFTTCMASCSRATRTCAAS